MEENFDAGIKAEIDGIMKNVDNVLKKLEEAGYGITPGMESEQGDPAQAAVSAP